MGESSKQFYARRQRYRLNENRPPIEPFNFDTQAHYPIGSGRSVDKPDVVYRSVLVYTPEIRRQLITAAAVRRQKEMVDVSVGVPKRPYVRQSFVDAVSGIPISEFSISFFFCLFLMMDVLQIHLIEG